MPKSTNTVSPKENKDVTTDEWLDQSTTLADETVCFKTRDRPVNPWKFIGYCCAIPVMDIAGFFNHYRHGLHLETVTFISFPRLIFLALVPVIVMTFILWLRLLRDNFRRNLPKRRLLLLFLFPATFIIPRIVKIPSFTDGAAHALSQLNISDQLVAATAEEIAKPKNDYWRLDSDRSFQIMTRDPFSKLNLKYADLAIRESSLLIEFGSPLADRWGFSISGIKGHAPRTPEGSSDLKTVSKEIIVFWGPQ